MVPKMLASPNTFFSASMIALRAVSSLTTPPYLTSPFELVIDSFGSICATGAAGDAGTAGVAGTVAGGAVTTFCSGRMKLNQPAMASSATSANSHQ